MKHTNEPQVLNEESVKVHDYSNNVWITPFNILEKNNKYFIILGNQIVSKEFDCLEYAEDYIKEKPYDLILALISLTIELQEQYKKEQEQLKLFKNESKC